MGKNFSAGIFRKEGVPPEKINMIDKIITHNYG